MAAGIRIDAPGTRLKNVWFKGLDVGVAATAGFQAENLVFDGVRQPFDISNAVADVSGTRITNDPKSRPAGPNKSHVGWSGTAGPALSAACPRCRSIFPSVNYKLRMSHFWSRDNEEVCPVCGYEHAAVADGLFYITEQAVKILLSLPSDKAKSVLEASQSISQDFLQERINAETAIGLYEAKTVPALAVLARKAVRIGKAASYAFNVAVGVASFLALYFAIQSYNLQLYDRSEEILEPESKRMF